MFVVFGALPVICEEMVKDTRSMVEHGPFSVWESGLRVLKTFRAHIQLGVVVLLLHALCTC